MRAAGGLGAAGRASLLVSPAPAALLVRKVFAAGGAKTAEALAKHAPADVAALTGQRYGDDPGMLPGLYRPAEEDPFVLGCEGRVLVPGVAGGVVSQAPIRRLAGRVAARHDQWA